MLEIKLQARKREDFRGSANNSLRKSGYVPGVIYGEGVNMPIAATQLSLRPLIYTSESHTVNLSVDGDNKSFMCIMKDIQFHPVTDKPIHFDLQMINANKPVEMEVPVMLQGQSNGVKEGGVIQHLMHKLTIECLPKDIPAHIDIDITELGIGDSIKVGDIKLENIKFLGDESVAVVSVVPPTVETTPAEGETAAEPELVAKKKSEE